MHVITSEIRAGTAWRSTQKLSQERKTRNAEGIKCWKIKYVVRRLRVKVAFKLSKEPWERNQQNVFRKIEKRFCLCSRVMQPAVQVRVHYDWTELTFSSARKATFVRQEVSFTSWSIEKEGRIFKVQIFNSHVQNILNRCTWYQSGGKSIQKHREWIHYWDLKGMPFSIFERVTLIVYQKGKIPPIALN